MAIAEFQPPCGEWAAVVPRPFSIDSRPAGHTELSVPHHVSKPLDALLITHMKDIDSYPDPWIYDIPHFTRIVLDSIAQSCPRLEELDDLSIHGVSPIAWASGALVRSYRHPIHGHFDASRNAAKVRLDPEWLDGLDPVARRAILRIITGPLDTDWRIRTGEESQAEVMGRLYQSIIAHLKTDGAKQRNPYDAHDRWFGLSTKTRPARDGDTLERTLVHAEEIILDTGLPCILVTYHLMRLPYHAYQIAITPLPVGEQKQSDFRLGDNQSVRMRDMVPVVVRPDHAYYLIDAYPRDQFIQTRYSGAEHIPHTHYESLPQAIVAAMRTIRGSIESETDIKRALNSTIPITDLVTESTIQGLRSELRRLVQQERDGDGNPPQPLRVGEIITEGNVLSNLNPFRFIQMAAAIGLLDIFIPDLGTLSETYDWRTNPVAREIIERFKPGRYLATDVFPDCYFRWRGHLGFDNLGITMILGALDEMGLIPWWQDKAPYAGASAFNLPGHINPIAVGAKFFDYREAMGRIKYHL